jgi:4-hydroxybenzoate polyprenyltransferase
VNLATGLVRALRPHQWTKNFFVFAPLLFAGEVRHEGRLLRVLAAFAIFSLMASAVYLLNDSFDRAADRAHPRKRFRPIASGLVPVPLALAPSCKITKVGGPLLPS